MTHRTRLHIVLQSTVCGISLTAYAYHAASAEIEALFTCMASIGASLMVDVERCYRHHRLRARRYASKAHHAPPSEMQNLVNWLSQWPSTARKERLTCRWPKAYWPTRKES